VERREIRDLGDAPDCASLHPGYKLFRHCEERSDEAIQPFRAAWIASLRWQ
jgi:hypothetical protein